MDIRDSAQRMTENVAKAIVGKEDVIELCLVALLCEGHVLLEDVPGIGKTTLAKAIARSLGSSFKRIQFTPDLLPSDVTGILYFNQKLQEFEFRPGPLMAQVVLADEINRATPRTQSALLEAMQERQVTIGGETFPMADPFLVLATQNPIEQEGTYPLPEAQVDRFLMKLRVGYPDRREERLILERMAGREVAEVDQVLDPVLLRKIRAAVNEVFVDEKIKNYILDIVFASRDPEAAGLDLAPLIAWGASPRATLALTQLARARALLKGRAFVIPEDVKAVGHDVLRHRILVTYEAEAENLTSDDIVTVLLDNIEVP